MSKKKYKAAQHCKINSWLSANDNCVEVSFIQVGGSLLKSPIFNSLAYSTRYIYLCCASEAAGKTTFNFPASFFKIYGFSESTEQRALFELAQNGFIKLTFSGKVNRLPNEYQFNYEWKGRA